MPKTKLLTNFLSSYEKHEQAKEAKSRISLFLHKKDVLDKKNNSKVRHSLSKDRHR